MPVPVATVLSSHYAMWLTQYSGRGLTGTH